MFRVWRSIAEEVPSHPDRLAHMILAAVTAYALGFKTYVDIACAALMSLFPDLDIRHEHRALLHNIFMCISIPVLFSFATGLPMQPLLIGTLSHIALDMINPSGVALFYPLSRRRLGFKTPIRSGWPSLFFVLALITFLWIAGILK